MLFGDIDPLNYILQGSALALLGYLIVWQFPQMMRDIRAEREAVVKERKSSNEAATEERKGMMVKFENMLNVLQDRQDARSLGLVTGIKEQTEELAGHLDRHTEAISKAVLGVCKSDK